MVDIWPGAIHNISIGWGKTRGDCCIACVLRPRIRHKETRRRKTKFLEVGETKAQSLIYLRKHPILTDLNWKIFIDQVSRETVPIALRKDSGYHTGTWSCKASWQKQLPCTVIRYAERQGTSRHNPHVDTRRHWFLDPLRTQTLTHVKHTRQSLITYSPCCQS